MGATAAVHPTDPILHAYGLGKLDRVSSDSVNKHLEGCDSCRRHIAELSSDDFLGRLQQVQIKSENATSGWSPSSSSSSDGARGPSASQPPVDTLPPELVEHPDWEIIRELGRGGMGVVYLARNKLMGRLEVLKVVGRHLIDRPGVLDRFLREIQSAARLRHVNIVTAYSAIRIGPGLVLTMEYVEGIDLAKMVKAKGPLPIAHACHFIHQAALGLQHAHERNMVHRDIKPANLIVASEGKKSIVKVLDFGLAKVTSEGQANDGLTREGQMLGTPDFIAPEQIRDAQSADIRADIYSLGCTLYHVLSGGPPFRGDHLWDIYQAHFSMDASPLNLVRPEVPVELAALVAKMMAKEPARRFQTPGEVAETLALFSKQGRAGSVGSRPEISRAGQPAIGRSTASADSPPAPTPDRAQGIARPIEKTPGQNRAGSALEGLIDVGEGNPIFDPEPDGPAAKAAPLLRRQGRGDASAKFAGLSGRRGRGMWAVAGVLLLALIVATFGIIKFRTANGVIVLENVPEDATVEFDGKQVTVITRTGQPMTIEAVPGDHRVTVIHGNNVLLRKNVPLESGKEFKLTISLEPLTAPKTTEKSPPPEGSDRESGTVVAGGSVAAPDAARSKSGATAGEVMSPSPPPVIPTSRTATQSVALGSVAEENPWPESTQTDGQDLPIRKERILGMSSDCRRMAILAQDKEKQFWLRIAVAPEDNGNPFGKSPDPYRLADFSPDGKHLAVGNSRGILYVWDIATGREVHRLEGNKAGIPMVKYSPDGKRIAAAGWDAWVRVWDASTGKLLELLDGKNTEFIGVAFSSDGAACDRAFRFGARALGASATCIRSSEPTRRQPYGMSLSTPVVAASLARATTRSHRSGT